VVELTWVDGKGTIRRSSRGSPEGRALCGGLGIVGVVTELTLALTEPTHTVATAARLVKDTDIVDDVMAMIKVSCGAG
jgi:FAD/FMN-containing dehydrogenase